MSRSYVFAILCVAEGLAGCALHHDREGPAPEPPCAPAECYAVTDSGCLDIDDFYTPDHCPAECPAGYAPHEGDLAFCEGPLPPGSCSVAPAHFGFEGPVTEGWATVSRVDRAGNRLELSASGVPLVFRAPDVSFLPFTVNDDVMVSVETAGGAMLHRIEGLDASVTAVQSTNAPPSGGFDVGGLHLDLGGATCRAPARAAECGMDVSYRLAVTNPFGDSGMLEPAETLGFAVPDRHTGPDRVPGGASAHVMHGATMEYGTDGCEVWDISFVVEEHHPRLFDP